MADRAPISRLTLGTVQLGMPYGINNTSGQPTISGSHELLQFALLNGINTIDTARIYGNAEAVIGSFQHKDRFTIITKFKLSDEALVDKHKALDEARESLKASYNSLMVKKIPICLFHQNKEQSTQKANRILPFVFTSLKKEGLIEEGGISVYKPSDLTEITDWEAIQNVQVPLNIFDLRIFNDNIIDTLIANNVQVFARSVFLQGLILMKELPASMNFAIDPLKKLESIASKNGMQVKEIAFAFVRDTAGITSVVVGAETIGQLKENIGLMSTPKLIPELYAEIKACFAGMPELLVTPALWPH